MFDLKPLLVDVCLNHGLLMDHWDADTDFDPPRPVAVIGVFELVARQRAFIGRRGQLVAKLVDGERVGFFLRLEDREVEVNALTDVERLELRQVA